MRTLKFSEIKLISQNTHRKYIQLQNPPRRPSSLFLWHLSAQSGNHHVRATARAGDWWSLTMPSWPKMTKRTKPHSPHHLETECWRWLKTEISVSNSMVITWWFSRGRHFCPLGNSWQCMETLLIVMIWGGVLLASSGQRPRMLLHIHLTVSRTTPYNKELSNPNVHSSQDEKPWSNQIMQ